MTKEIDDILKSYHYRTLQSMAEAAGLETGRRKTELVSKMKGEFFTEERVRASLEKPDERERAVLNRLLLHGGEADTRSFRRELIRADLATGVPKSKKPKRSHYRSGVPYDRGAYVGRPHRPDSDIFQDVIARLTLYGLIFSRGTAQSSGGTSYKVRFHPASTLYIPKVIRPYMPEPEPVPPPLADWEPDRVSTGTPTLLLRDLYLYWDFTRRHDVALIRGGFVGKRSLRAINDGLLVPDLLLEDVRREDSTERLYLLRQLLERLGLVHKEEGHLRPTDEEPLEVPAFWEQDQTEQLSACLEAWPTTEGAEGLGEEAEEYNLRCTRARQIVLDALASLQPDTWLEPQDLLLAVQGRDVNFLFAKHREVENRQDRRYYSSYYHRSARKKLQAYERLEAEFVEKCLAGFLHQIGAVDLGYEDDALHAFRLTLAGRAMLGLEAEGQPSQQPQGKLIIQPTFEVMAMGPVSLAVLARLDLFAERQRADQVVFEYRLSRESVYEAQQQGLKVREVIRFLEQASETGLPQNVRRSLEEWGAYHERIVFRTGVSLLQAADEELLETLMEDSRIGKHLARSVSSEAALVRKRRQPQLVAALVEQGRFPAISDARPESADDSVIISEDGSVQPIHAVPSFYLRRRLSRLAEETDDGGWRLTPAAIRRAGGGKNKVLRLLEELSRLHRGPLPSGLVEQVKAQGGYYGQADVETLTLIEFRDRATLDELIERAIAPTQLQELLTPFSAGDRALAVVPANELPRVEEILAHFGVRVKHGL